MVNDPLTTVQLIGAEAIFMLGADDDPGTLANVDVELVLDDGSRWSATVLSLAEVDRLMRSWEVTGECFNGSYFHGSDFVIVREPGLPKMIEIFSDLVTSGDYRSVLNRVDIET